MSDANLLAWYSEMLEPFTRSESPPSDPAAAATRDLEALELLGAAGYDTAALAKIIPLIERSNAEAHVVAIEKLRADLRRRIWNERWRVAAPCRRSSRCTDSKGGSTMKALLIAALLGGVPIGGTLYVKGPAVALHAQPNLKSKALRRLKGRRAGRVAGAIEKGARDA